MAQTAVQTFYRYHAYVYDWTRWTILHGRRRAVEQLSLRPDSDVLEVGCGTGLNFAYALRKLDARGRLTGVDFSADMLRRAARRVAAHAWSNVELRQDDASQMRLGRLFDAILFAYSLTMIPNWPAALRSAHEHLRPGGRLVVLDFSRFGSWGPMAPVMRQWLRLNHVETLAPYEDTLRSIFGQAQVTYWLGGYNFTAVAERKA